MPRKEGWRGLTRIKDYVDASIQGIEEYNNRSKERLFKAASNSIGNISKEEKQLYGYFKLQTDKIAYEKNWA